MAANEQNAVADKTLRKPLNAMEAWLHRVAILNQAELMRRLKEEYSSLPKRPQVLEITQFWANMTNKKNRYVDIPCLDKTRVRLRKFGTDYIHANWVQLPDQVGRVVMAQAPMENTVYDFWRIIIDENVQLIISLTKGKEKGVEKCFTYWPTETGSDDLKFNDVIIRNLSKRKGYGCVITKLEARDKTKNKITHIKHLLYLDWPDHKVPTCTHTFISMLDYCNEVMTEKCSNGKGVTLIHCSAGVGRSGTLMTLLVLRNQIEKGIVPDIPQLIKQLRQQRTMAVQGIEQYAFIYRTAVELTYYAMECFIMSEDEMFQHIRLLKKLTTRSACDLSQYLSKDKKGADNKTEIADTAISDINMMTAKKTVLETPKMMQLAKERKKPKDSTDKQKKPANKGKSSMKLSIRIGGKRSNDKKETPNEEKANDDKKDSQEKKTISGDTKSLRVEKETSVQIFKSALAGPPTTTKSKMKKDEISETEMVSIAEKACYENRKPQPSKTKKQTQKKTRRTFWF